LTPFIASEKNQRHENFSIFSNSFWSSVDRRPIIRAGNHPIASECDESKRGSTRGERTAERSRHAEDDGSNDGAGEAERESQAARQPGRHVDLRHQNVDEPRSERPAAAIKRHSRKKADDGRRYFIGEFTGKMQMPGPDGKMKDMTFKGMSFEGYDNAKQKFVSSWIDNMGTGIMMSEGTYDPATKAFTYTSEIEMMPGMKQKVREVIKIVDNNHHTFEWYEDRGGQEAKTMEIKYTRKK